MTDFICPEADHHGNPFRYCPVKGCGWMEETPVAVVPVTDEFERMYFQAQMRYMAVTDAVFEKLADGDVPGLIEIVMNIADDCDYVDEESIEMARRAAERYPSDERYPESKDQ